MEQHQRRNIIVFGATGVGKSSLINALAGQSLFPVGNVAKGIGETQRIRGTRGEVEYEFSDTCGLSEADLGTVPGKKVIPRLVELVKNAKNGLNLPVYVLPSRVTATTYPNYKLLVETITKGQVPL
jgi:ribosome biogenesis GTPase A